VSEPVRVEQLSAEALQVHLPAFTALLHRAVHAGAAIHFVVPLPEADAERFWRVKVLPPVAAGVRVLFAAWCGEALAGTVQLDCDMPPNQPHRAEVAKLMVDPGHRRKGVARRLMLALEAEAARRGRSLITLDTRTGDHAEPLYTSLGYQTAGVIPGYALDPIVPRLDPTTIMFKSL
jgi:ribosomal protein S18 acetylase RimI-like enzyme